MSIGKENLYNYNNGAYSATGYPFQADQLKLQASYSTSVYDAGNLQSVVYVTVTLANIGIDWGYSSGKEVSLYWNDNLVSTFNPPNLYTQINVPNVTTLGTASFPVQHQQDGTCTGTLKVEWNSRYLMYTVGGVSINVTELGCKATVTPDTISGGTVPTDVFLINGKSFIEVLKKDGLEFSRAEVNKKSVITMSGTEWATEKKRHTIKVSLLDMSGDQYSEYAGYMATNPASVTYKDEETGKILTSTFYISEVKHKKRMVIPGVTYLTEISFVLTERFAT